SSGSISVLLGNGDATFQNPVSFVGDSFWKLRVGDFNGDGKPDLVALDTEVGYLRILTAPRQSPRGDYSILQRNPAAVCGDMTSYAYRRVMKDGTMINFNSQGLHKSTVDRNCNKTTYTYDDESSPNGKLTSISDPGGLLTQFSYVAPGLR